MKRVRYLFLVVAAACATDGSLEVPRVQPRTASASAGLSYTTAFPLAESPISEGGRWINGGTVGLDWTNVSTTPGLAIGHQVGASYTDATALLTGAWNPDQQATGTVYASGTLDEACYSEVELRLRSAVTAHNSRGYEISFKVSPTSSAYLIIVRWNGALGDFTFLFNSSGAQYGVKQGDVVTATVVGNVITAYKNGVQLAQVTDATYTDGSPGMGFNLENGAPGCAGTNDRYGFSSYSAGDAVVAAPPTPVSLALSPTSATLQSGQSQVFAAVATLSDGSTQANPSVTWVAAGGAITTGGMYTAGATTGTFPVTATLNGTALSATAGVSILPAGGSHSYTTNFPLTENPILEGGRWINGGSVGLDWTNVSTTPGIAIGHQVGADFTDATALLSGAWNADQQAVATIYAPVALNEACANEVELRLRSSVSAHNNRGYEVGFKVSQSSSAYLIIVRWNGALGDFTMLRYSSGSQYGVKHGDVISATLVGNVITAYKNGVQMGQVTDNTFANGSPGMGFDLDNAPAGCAGTNGNYGFSSFTATDVGTVPAPTITAITVTPSSATLVTGQTQAFTAAATMSDGTTQANPSVTWSATGGTVTSAGVFTAGGAAGTFLVTATSASGPVGTSAVTIATPAITGITVAPSAVNLQSGQTRAFTATATLSNGGTQLNPSVTWSATGGTITTAGVYTAGSAAGNFQVTATSAAGPAGTSAVTVTLNALTVTGITVTPSAANLQTGQTQNFTAAATLSDGTTQANPIVTWTATGGTITSAGAYTAGGSTGTFQVKATSAGGLSGTSSVTIGAPTITGITVAPKTATLVRGQARTFVATATLSNGGTQANPTVTWSAGGGTITSAGAYTAGTTLGTFRVIARNRNGSNAHADTAIVTIVSAAITGITVTPATATLQSGQSRTFIATATLSNGGTQANPSVTWSATGGTITLAGFYIAGVTPGSFRVMATLTTGAISGFANVTIATTGRTYATLFPLTENPISEGGMWTNGGSTGLDWTNVSTTPGLAIGHQVGADYTDATALLTGTWSANQRATATVFTSGVLNDACSNELELRLRSSVSAHDSRGYEIGFAASQTASAYLIIVRWNGALGNFTVLFSANGAQYGVKNGDVVSASIVGNVITAYKNSVQMAQVTDGTFAGGGPGMGFYLNNAASGCSGTNGKYGFTSFIATDGIAP